MFECKLVTSKRQTAFGPLCLLGHYLSQEGVLEPQSRGRGTPRCAARPISARSTCRRL